MKAILILILLVLFAIIFGAITFWNFSHERYLYDYEDWFVCNGWMHKTYSQGFLNLKYCGFDPGVHSV